MDTTCSIHSREQKYILDIGKNKAIPVTGREGP
jgi:hypothetical protein